MDPLNHLAPQGGTWARYSMLNGAEPVTIWAGESTRHAVALTFDDGPSPLYTPKILALLKQYQAHATFFVLGRKVEKYPGLVQAELRAGHEVGNHSYSHPYLTKSSQFNLEKEVKCTDMALDLLGCPKKGRLMRPPFSAVDDRLTAYIAHKQQHLALWSIDSGDWRGLGSEAIVKNVLTRVKNGSIVIFHDSDEKDQADRTPTIEALEVILPALQAEGYELVTVSELVARRDPKKNH
jgi:peptidoglycan/xylan/chitin deacetylase (PgdA/CDA1 family)